MTNKLLTITLLTFMMAGCGSNKTVLKKYYLIEPLAEATSAVAEQTADVLCEVADVMVAPAFATTQIALRDESHQIQYFGQHEWAVRPQETFLHHILKHLSDRQTFKRVANRFWHTPATYTLNTQIHNLEVIQKEKAFFAHLHIEFTLIETKTDRIILKHKADKERQLEEKDLNLMAQAVSELLSEELVKLTDLIEAEISDYPTE
ncbi:MAG: PqiC family protein [Bacteroidales bacterium]|nr:PqiC family protein [Bacteroidales bacterium]